MYRHIIFDFDGVLADSNAIRINGFKPLFSDFSHDDIDALLAFAEINGGLSRYVKIRYFFNTIRHETVSEDVVQQYAQRYSDIVKNNVIRAPAVKGSEAFLKTFKGTYTFAIVSGSDQEELVDICRIRGIAHYFEKILGSPVTKEQNLKMLLADRGWDKETCVFVGDSINDHTAACAVGIPFIGLNSGMTEWANDPQVLSFDTFDEMTAYLSGHQSVLG